MSNSQSHSIHLSDADWTELKGLTTRLLFDDNQKSVLLISIARAAGTNPRNSPWANLAKINGQSDFFTQLFDLLQHNIQDPRADRVLVDELHRITLRSNDKAYLEHLLKGGIRVETSDMSTIHKLWYASLDLANQITELPIFLNEQIAKGGSEIRIDHIPKVMNAVRVGLPRFKIELDNNDYADAQNSLKELYDRYNGYIDLLNKGSQRTTSLEEINKYFKEELEDWIGKVFLPTMERVCSKPKTGSQSA